MRLKKWNLVTELITIFLYSLTLLILFKPWINFFYKNLKYQGTSLLNNYFSYWFIIFVISAVFIGEYIGKVENKVKKIAGSFIFMFINLVIIYLFGWKVLFFLPLSIILLLLAYRYNYYNINLDYKGDIGYAIIFFLVNLISMKQFSFNINYGYVFLFFFSVIALNIFLNQEGMKKRGFTDQSNTITIIITGFLFVLTILSLLLAFILQKNYLKLVLNIMWSIYNIFVDILMFFLTPILKLLTPVMNLLAKFWYMAFSSSEDNSLPNWQNFVPQSTNISMVETPINNMFLIIFWILIVFLLIYFTIKLNKNKKADQEEGFIEERESIFSFRDLEKDLKSLWARVRNVLLKNKKRYNSSNPVMVVREIYYKFLIKFNAITTYHLYETPLDYYEKLTRFENRDYKKNIMELTSLYNIARYKGVISNEEVKRVKRLWDNIKSLL